MIHHVGNRFALPHSSRPLVFDIIFIVIVIWKNTRTESIIKNNDIRSTLNFRGSNKVE